MTTITGTPLAWQHGTDTLTLLVGTRPVRLPDRVAHRLLTQREHPPTGDPATDLLHLEQDLRWQAALLAGQIEQAAADIAVAREENRVADTEPGRFGQQIRRATSAYLAEAIADHNVLVTQRQQALDAIYEVRACVINAHVPDGWLAEAAAGWLLDPRPPAWVQVFPREKAFRAGDSRRVVESTWGGTSLAGKHFGFEWRRDGDDDDPLSREFCRGGMWWLAWCAATHEIYAARHNPYLADEVWVLGTGFDDPDTTTAFLSTLEVRMRMPNSLLLAAEQVRRNYLLRKADQ